MTTLVKEESTLDTLCRIWEAGKSVKEDTLPRRMMVRGIARVLCGLGNLAVMDTETTGLSKDDEVCELAVVSGAGDVLYHSLIRPTKAIPGEATQVHGIKAMDVLDSPTMRQAGPDILSILDGKFVVAYNGVFDFRLIRQSLERVNAPRTLRYRSRPWDEVDGEGAVVVDTVDVMRLHAAWHGERKKNGAFMSKKLSHAVEHLGLSFEGQAHGALADAKATLAVLKHLAHASVTDSSRSHG